LNAASHSPLKLRYGFICMVNLFPTTEFWLAISHSPKDCLELSQS